MVEENLSQQFRLKNIDEIGNYFVGKIHQNELINKKHKTLSYIEHFIILASVVITCISVSAFTPLRGVLLGIASPAIDCAITAGIK